MDFFAALNLRSDKSRSRLSAPKIATAFDELARASNFDTNDAVAKNAVAKNAVLGEGVSSKKRLHVRLSPRTRNSQQTDVLILGAGLSGTSLAHYLVEAGFQGQITLLDKRIDFAREQRWCTWSEIPPSMLPLVSHSWNSWKVCANVGGEQREARCTSHEYSYREIYAPRFFRHFHATWRDSKQVQLLLGQEIGLVEPNRDHVWVRTLDKTWRASWVFDTRFHSELDDQIPIVPQTRSAYFAQTFVGRVVEFERDVFTPSDAILMDFRLPQPPTEYGAGVHFGYVLPYSRRRALVETTAFTPSPLHRETHNSLLDCYLRTHFGTDYRMTSEEAGFVPMTSARASLRTPHQRVWRLGVAGGLARPSSGYAFANIQRATQSVAQQIVAQQKGAQQELDDAQVAASSSKYRVLDDVFLEALRTSPQFAGECFMRLFERTPTDCLVRFLIEKSSLIDDCRIIAALPKLPFLTASTRCIAAKLAKQNA